MFNDEVNGYKYYCRYWNDANLHFFSDSERQFDGWFEVVIENIIGPLIFQELEENVNLQTINFFQRDGVHTYYLLRERGFIDARFPGQLIRFRSPIECTARPPD